MESSSDESNVESSLDESSSEEGDLALDDVRADNTLEGLGDNGGVQSEVKENSFRPVCKIDAGSYLRGIQRCGSSATTKREKRRKREMEKSASGSRSIVEMFSSQHSKNQSRSQDTTSDFAPVPPLSTELKGEKFQVVETLFELRTRAVNDLTDLLRLKTKQLDTYEHVLDPKSNFYRRHQMVQSFLWM